MSTSKSLLKMVTREQRSVRRGDIRCVEREVGWYVGCKIPSLKSHQVIVRPELAMKPASLGVLISANIRALRDDC
jgi:hypothetical protein